MTYRSSWHAEKAGIHAYSRESRWKYVVGLIAMIALAWWIG